MAERQTMNVSLPLAQEQFVRSQVASGRYRSASEVVRDGLRLLEEAEQRRLLEKWLVEGLSEEEARRLPAGLLDRARDRLRELLDEGVRSGEEHGWIDGDEAMRRLRRRGKRRRAG
ncbi:MAG: type II toxin-antitoxin system ParD family antitoxin [Phycisphaerales bacterium JB039]